MTDGGVYAWKRQTITGNVADYSCLSRPLPNPPKGQEWFRNSFTGEWSVVDVEETEKSDELVIGSATAAVPVRQEGLLPEDCDFLQHKVEPTDTLQGICLRYGITPVTLRQVNKFSGSNLMLAPTILTIPLKRSAGGKLGGGGGGGGVMSAERKKQSDINQFLLALRKFQSSETAISTKEALSYLEMNDGNVEMAIEDAKNDFGWEVGEDEKSALI